MILEGFFITTLFLFGGSNVKCGEIPSVNEAYKSADVVFVGKVIEVTRLKDERQNADNKPLPPMFPTDKVRLKVKTAYRGINKDVEVELETIPMQAEWGVFFKKDEIYLVYANRKITKDSKIETLRVGGCGRTKLISNATEELRIIEELHNSDESAK